jgi:transcriptional regulator with PAS, ATPase and Fis domain
MLKEKNSNLDRSPILEGRIYPAILEKIRDAVIAVHPSGIIRYLNTAATTCFDLRLGTQLESAFPELRQPLFNTLKDQQNCLNLNVTIDQRQFTANLYVVREQGKPAGALCLLENRTEMNQIIQKMMSFQELSRELDTIIDSSYDGLWICDANATVLRINSASERLNNIRAAA